MDTTTNKMLTLKETALAMNLTTETVRTLLRNKRLAGQKNDNGHWRISPNAIEQYNNTKGKRKTKVAYIIKLTPSELAELKPLLAQRNLSIAQRYKKKV